MVSGRFLIDGTSIYGSNMNCLCITMNKNNNGGDPTCQNWVLGPFIILMHDDTLAEEPWAFSRSRPRVAQQEPHAA